METEGEDDTNVGVIPQEEDSMDYNIQMISKAGGVSPRHTNSLKVKKGRPTLPLQVRTRSSKGDFSSQ